MIDQIMVSKGLLTCDNVPKVVDDLFTIFRPKRIRDRSKPKTFRMKKNNTWEERFSDHFAVLVKINIL
ncbi:MAG: hypothetical protein KJO12_08025 [Ignavibacteria bacterium]|nr:hypothetical protein [Ignavibacteria bacterium]